jgi:hypothetical protein
VNTVLTKIFNFFSFRRTGLKVQSSLAIPMQCYGSASLLCGFGSEHYLLFWCGSRSGSYLSIWCGSESRSYHSLFRRFGPSNAPKWPLRLPSFTFMRIRILVFPLMLIRILPFTLMRIRIWVQIPKMMRIHADPDPHHCTHESFLSQYRTY